MIPQPRPSRRSRPNTRRSSSPNFGAWPTGCPSASTSTPQSVEQGLAKLVLTLIELIRRLLEKQAVRRMEGGGLSAEQVEELGLALMKLEEKMAELKEHFGLQDEELNIDLGPIGKLI